jgi:hypothetical protein
MREHGILRRILIVYREVAPKLVIDAAAVDAAALGSAAELFQAFSERYHEQLLEEQHIFPIVRKAGGEAAALVETPLSQHVSGREITSYTGFEPIGLHCSRCGATTPDSSKEGSAADRAKSSLGTMIPAVSLRS